MLRNESAANDPSQVRGSIRQILLFNSAKHKENVKVFPLIFTLKTLLSLYQKIAHLCLPA